MKLFRSGAAVAGLLFAAGAGWLALAGIITLPVQAWRSHHTHA